MDRLECLSAQHHESWSLVLHDSYPGEINRCRYFAGVRGKDWEWSIIR